MNSLLRFRGQYHDYDIRHEVAREKDRRSFRQKIRSSRRERRLYAAFPPRLSCTIRHREFSQGSLTTNPC